MLTIIKFSTVVVMLNALLAGAHWLVYTTIHTFFAISDPTVERMLKWIMVCLALSFLPSALLLRLHANIFTGGIYLLASLWLGLLLYLLFSCLFIWLVFGMGSLIGHVPNMRALTIILFLVAIAITFYGTWRARHPVVTHLTVELEQLPPQWQNALVIQLSDIHLGSINGTGFMHKIAEIVNNLNPDMILITGDLFDGMGGDLSLFIEPLNRLKARKGVFFVTGNHEGYVGLDVVIDTLNHTSIQVLDNEIIDIEGLQIIGISFPEHDRENCVKSLLGSSGPYDRNKPSILMYHTPTNIAEYHQDRGVQQTRTYWTPDISKDLVMEAGVDLQLSGHTHQGQLFPFGFLTRVIYRGYDYGLHNDNGFHLYVTSGVGTWGPPLRIGSPPEIVALRLQPSNKGP